MAEIGLIDIQQCKYVINEIEYIREHPHTTSDFLGGGGVKPNPIFYM